MKRVVTLIGTRPEIIKMSSLIPELDRVFDHVLVDSGQHYSPEMHSLFFRELQLRPPDHSLGVGSERPGRQVAMILDRFEEVLLKVRPAAVIVQGDTNTALAGALAACKQRESGVRLVHVEAGARSFIRDQPEELNRKIVDQLSDLLFAPYEGDRDNLAREGIDSGRVRVVGNTVVDSCRRMVKAVGSTREAAALGLTRQYYVFATFHRQETVDDPERLRNVCQALQEIASIIPVVVPLHPRTRKMLAEHGVALEGPGLIVTEPLGYPRAVSLLLDCRFCVTDSGGVQEEAAILNIPALVLRESTEHRRYVEAGMHVIVGTERPRIVREATVLVNGASEYERRRSCRISFRDDTTSTIVAELEAFLGAPRPPRPRGVVQRLAAAKE